MKPTVRTFYFLRIFIRSKGEGRNKNNKKAIVKTRQVSRVVSGAQFTSQAPLFYKKANDITCSGKLNRQKPRTINQNCLLFCKTSMKQPIKRN